MIQCDTSPETVPEWNEFLHRSKRRDLRAASFTTEKCFGDDRQHHYAPYCGCQLSLTFR